LTEAFVPSLFMVCMSGLFINDACDNENIKINTSYHEIQCTDVWMTYHLDNRRLGKRPCSRVIKRHLCTTMNTACETVFVQGPCQHFVAFHFICT